MKNPVQKRTCRSRRSRHGFTLLELLVVILIIGLLTGIVGPRFMSQISRSEATAAKAQIDAFEKALEAYRIDTGRYPSSSQGLQALVNRPADEARWRGPYLKDQIPADPWGTPYEYRQPGRTGKEYDILSLGRDRTPGGSDDDADVTN